MASTGCIEENKDLCSVVSYPDRGPWGDSRYSGNCSGYLVKDLILRFNCQSVFDPAEGSGTVRDVVSGINQYLKKRHRVRGQGPKTRMGYPDRLPCLIGSLTLSGTIRPTGTLSGTLMTQRTSAIARTLEDFELKLNQSVERLFQAVKPGGIMAILIGDKRKDGRYYPLFRTLLMNPNIGQLKAIIIKVQHHCRSDSRNYGDTEPLPDSHQA